MPAFPNDGRAIFLLLAALLLIAAVATRAPGLGRWNLAEDEYYYSQPVAFILEKGVPEYPAGGYYTRGIGLQYLTTIPARLFTKWEFAVRLLPMLFGALTVPLFFLLAGRFLSTLPAILCSSMLLLSSWHIEFSRFARFYAPFQFLFLLYVYALYEGYWRGRSWHKYLAFGLGLLAIAIDKYSIFLPIVLLLLVVIRDDMDRKTAATLVLQAFLLLAANLLLTFRNVDIAGVTVSPAPAGAGAPVAGSLPVFLPAIGLLRHVADSAVTLVPYVLLIGTGAYLFRKCRPKHGDFWGLAVLSLSVALPLLHQYALLLFVLPILLINKRSSRTMFLENARSWAIYIGGTLACWAGVAYLSGNTDKILFFLVGFPPVKHAIYVPFRDNVPILGAFLASVVLLSTGHHLAREQSPGRRFLVSLVLGLLFVMPFFNTPQKSTRYIYFFFPLILILAYSETASLAEWVEITLPTGYRKPLATAILLLPIPLYMATEDFHVRHILGVSSAQANYRMGEFDRYSRHWYPRVDFEEPSKYVNRVFSEGDAIIVDHVGATRYIDKPYVFYVHRREPERYPYHARKGGTVEKWTGKPLLSTPEELAALVPEDGNRSLWLITSVVKGRAGSSFMGTYHNVGTITEQYNLRAILVFTGSDGRIGVWKITRPPETLLRNAGQMGGKS